jgi:membrane protease YdiL (CAAX protease family)
MFEFRGEAISLYPGTLNIILALVLGAVLTAVYLWRRDLVANMIGHFMIDLIATVLPRLLLHS